MNKWYLIFQSFAIVILSIVLLFYYNGFKEYKNENKELAGFEYIREGIILEVTDACVYVYDNYDNTGMLIEVDIFDELIHCDIEVGDTAVYVIDFEYTDADLLGIIKKECVLNHNNTEFRIEII